jgi:DNA-binding SARP family transcriptional activator
VKFGLLGPLAVANDDGTLVEIHGRKIRVLAAILLCRANQPVPVESLVDALWGRTPPRRAGANLRVYVHRLRQALDDSRIDRSSDGYRLRVRPEELDVDRFRTLLAEGRHAVSNRNPVHASAAFRAAVALWRGPALAGLVGVEALGAEASRLEELRLDALEQRFEAELSVGRRSEISAELRVLSTQHPFRETFRAQLMRALVGSGRSAEAVAVFEETRRLLADEFGVDPSPQLRRLHLSILRDDPTLQPPSAGESARPAVATLATASGDVPPRQLPGPPTGFTGRSRNVRQLDNVLIEGGDGPATTPVATISGAAGIGKTAMAVHWAHVVANQFPDGQIYIDLNGSDPTCTPLEPSAVLGQILSVLDVPAARIPVSVGERESLYRTMLADRRMLVVLDDVHDAGQVRPLLPVSSGSFVLVTSRNLLAGLATAVRHPIVLDPLTSGEAVDLLRVRLGVERIAAEPSAVAEIVDQCGGLPLLLSAAASRAVMMPELPLSALAAELSTARRTPDDDSTLAHTALAQLPHTRRHAERARSVRPPLPASTAGNAALEFRVLGPLQILVAGREISVDPARQRVALAVLILERNRVVPVERLVDAIWADQPPRTAREQVHICVSALRRLLAAAGGPDLIQTVRPGYLLRCPYGSVDIDVFEDLVERGQGDAEAGQAAAAAEKLRTALGLWRGLAFAGVESRTVRSRAEWLAEARLAAVEGYLDAELALGRNETVLEQLSVLVGENPSRERLHAQQMLALYRSGRTADALEAYRRVRRKFVDEFGIEPGAKLRELERAILTDDPRLAPTVPAGSAVAPVPRQLPPAIADLAGRDDLVRHLVALLTPAAPAQAVRIVVITGRGGVGKSALAVHLAHQISDQFPDGQLFADLRGAEQSPADIGRLLGRFLRELGVPGATVPAGPEARTSAFRSLVAGRRMLILLDDAASEQQVQALLPGTAGHLVVVTTRRRLTGLAGARHVEVGTLDESASIELLSATVDGAVVMASPTATRALIERCGRLPLALRIAAARLAARPHWKVGDLLERLDDEHRRLDELVHGDLSVRSSIAITYEALPKPARRLFRLLSVPAWATLPHWAAAPLLDQDPATAGELLEMLIEARAVEVVAGGDRTYRLHDLLKAYARERLAAEEPPKERLEALSRLLGCQLYLTEQAHRLDYGGDYTVLHGPAPRWNPDTRTVTDLLVKPLAWMEQERGRIVDSVLQASQEGLHEYAWDLTISSVFLFERGLHLDDWRETAEASMRAAQRYGDTRGEAAMLYSLGALALHQHQPELARRDLTAAERLFAQLGSPHGRGLALRNLAFLDRVQGRRDSATAKYRESLALLRSAGDRAGEAHVLVGLAQIYLEHRELDRAKGLLDKALAIGHAIGLQRGVAQTMYAIGELQLIRNEYEEARRQFTAVLATVQQTGDSTGEAYSRLGLGVAVLRQCRRAGQEIEELLRQERFAEADQADTARRRRLREAGDHLRSGLEHARRAGERMLEARLLVATAEACVEEQREATAATHVAQAVEIFGELGAKPRQAQAYRQLGDIHLAVGNDAAAIAAHAAEAAVLATLPASSTGRDSA